MKKIERAKANVYEIDHRLAPAITVKQGEHFVLETEDAASGYIREESFLPYPKNRPTHRCNPALLNPVAGPVFIEGAEKGDLVVVTIEKIVPDSQGYTILQPGDGLLGDSLKYRKTNDFYTRIFKHIPGASGTLADGACVLNERVRWRMAPFIGTLCLAPEREVPSSVYVQGPWGGNLDSHDFCEGSKIYLNSYTEGGMLFAGDVHGCQGDGELSGTANETRAELTLSCTVIKGKKIPHVRIEKPETIVGVATGKPLEFAVRDAFINLLEWVKEEYGFEEREAYLLLTACPDCRINVYQMVDLPSFFYTAGVEIPQKYLVSH
ncbi:MAG: acetamidase/formamidase family protein [Candidatus Latescibacterota bacterium]